MLASTATPLGDRFLRKSSRQPFPYKTREELPVIRKQSEDDLRLHCKEDCGCYVSPPMLNLLLIAQLLNQFPLLCTLCRSCLQSSLDRFCNTARLAEGPAKSSWAAPKYPTVNSQKAKPCGPKLELPTSFTLVRRMGARFDGTLQIYVSDGTSMRFRTPESDLCPLQEHVLDNRREGGAEQVMCEPYIARPVAENHHSWLT
jgi:hypothetical protein